MRATSTDARRMPRVADRQEGPAIILTIVLLPLERAGKQGDHQGSPGRGPLVGDPPGRDPPRKIPPPLVMV